MPCLGEKHAPLSLRMLIVFMLILVECSLLFLAPVMLSSCFSCLSFKSFYLGCYFWNSLEVLCLSCLESWHVALSCVSYFELVIEVAILVEW